MVRGWLFIYLTQWKYNMSRLDDLLQTIVKDVDGALGCAVVDLESGLLLGVAHNVPYFTSSYLEAVAAPQLI